MKTFLICPVRGHDPEELMSIVEGLESKGWQVHYPPRDTNQNDPTGFNICEQNFMAIKRADVVHVFWDGKSQGSIFDLGMAFALNKRIKVISLPEPTEGKSFQNMIKDWEGKCLDGPAA